MLYKKQHAYCFTNSNRMCFFFKASVSGTTPTERFPVIPKEVTTGTTRIIQRYHETHWVITTGKIKPWVIDANKDLSSGEGLSVAQQQATYNKSHCSVATEGIYNELTSHILWLNSSLFFNYFYYCLKYTSTSLGD